MDAFLKRHLSARSGGGSSLRPRHTEHALYADCAPRQDAASNALRALHMVRDQASKRCWEGYEATPGKKAYSDGSCQKKGMSDRKKKKKKTVKKEGGGDKDASSSDSSSSEDEGGTTKKKKAKKESA